MPLNKINILIEINGKSSGMQKVQQLQSYIILLKDNSIKDVRAKFF